MDAGANKYFQAYFQVYFVYFNNDFDQSAAFRMPQTVWWMSPCPVIGYDIPWRSMIINQYKVIINTVLLF